VEVAPAPPHQSAPPNDVPAQAAPAADPEPQLTPQVADLCQQLDFRKPAKTRIQAAAELGKLGERGKPASRALCQSLADEMRAGVVGRREVRMAMAEALEKVNPPLYQSVIPVIVDSSGANRQQALEQILAPETEGKPAVPIVLYIRDRERGGRQRDGGFLVSVLAAIAPDEKPITNLFAKWLARDRDPQVRVACAEALARVQGGRDKIADLVSATRDPAEGVRVAAVVSLGELGVAKPIVLKALALAKTDPSAQVRRVAQVAMEKLKGE
jgi:HEAT repeat protein